MDIDTIIGLIVILLGMGGFAAFFVFLANYINKKKKHKTGLFSHMPTDGKSIDLNVITDLGVCKINGMKKEFRVYFDGEQVGFLVRNGVITEYKTKNSSNYKEYPVGKVRGI